jgi:protein kinase
MNAYKIQERLGDGAFGEVAKALHPETGATVAIKRIKRHFHTWEECLQLRELQSLKKLGGSHPNIVKLKQVVREEKLLYFVFEFCETNLHRVVQQAGRGGVGEARATFLIGGVLGGLAHIHKNGFFHRDLKPENILVGAGGVAKIADFGCAREIRSRPPFTVYVATRWYRAPELLLSAPNYSSPIDLWAVGCIYVEMLRGTCLFPGASEADMLVRICKAFGTPTVASSPQIVALAGKKQFKLPQHGGEPLADLVPGASADALALLAELFAMDPTRRPSAAACVLRPVLQRAAAAGAAAGAAAAGLGGAAAGGAGGAGMVGGSGDAGGAGGGGGAAGGTIFSGVRTELSPPRKASYDGGSSSSMGGGGGAGGGYGAPVGGSRAAAPGGADLYRRPSGDCGVHGALADLGQQPASASLRQNPKPAYSGNSAGTGTGPGGGAEVDLDASADTLMQQLLEETQL